MVHQASTGVQISLPFDFVIASFPTVPLFGPVYLALDVVASVTFAGTVSSGVKTKQVVTSAEEHVYEATYRDEKWVGDHRKVKKDSSITGTTAEQGRIDFTVTPKLGVAVKFWNIIGFEAGERACSV